jgi:diguanylate cyclase (GGDEF)-like protein
VLRDVTERRRRAESIVWQATHDPLTGTINRAEFELRLKKLYRSARDEGGNVHSLLYIDADRFKFINDTYGHAAGDAAIKTLSDVLRARIRGADTLARVGGDEFTALLYSCGADRARLIAEGLRNAVEKHEFTWHGVELPLAVSIGVVEINRDSRTTAQIMRAADAACYAAKKRGRNRVHVSEPQDDGSQTRAFDFVRDIQTAIHGNRLELFYQPLCPADGGGSVSCELSVGVRDERGHLLPRADLDELTRRYHLSEDIDRWLVKAAIDAVRLNHPSLSSKELVMVPLSQQSLADERQLEHLAGIVKDHPDEARRLGFVLDQPGVAAQLDYLRYFVSAMKQHGCRILIGDLGFGSEAIGLMKSLQADYLGIPAGLVARMLDSSVDYEIVLGMSRVARSLGMQTVAESAPTESLREALAKMGVDFVKGQLNEGPRPVAIHSEAQWI